MLCLLILHRVVILFSSPVSVLVPSATTSKTKWRTPLLLVQCLMSTFDGSRRGGGGDNRVSQASASSVVRLDKLPSCIVETQWNGIVQNIAFTVVSRVLTMPSPSLTQFGSPRRGWVKVAWPNTAQERQSLQKKWFPWFSTARSTT